MVHIAPIPPWRRRVQRIVGGLLAALGVVVLVIAIIALRQPNGHQAALRTSGVAESSASTPATSPTPTPTVSSSAPSSSSAAPTSTAPTTPTTDPLKAVPLIVLNNTSKTGLADTAAGRFKAGGWTVSSTGNLSNDILSTCAYYDPSVANAQAAATELKTQFPAIKRVAAKFSGLPAGPIVVVLTSDYS
jgi:LytR cell envelope-related transcriptional attenuator